MSDLADIIARLEKATGPDRELDRAIWFGVGNQFPHTPEYTASMDAALLLMPPHHRWKIGCGHYVQYIAEVQDNSRRDRGWYVGECDSTPATALCIAALRARQAAALNLAHREQS
jgi:hypothetical protein